MYTAYNQIFLEIIKLIRKKKLQFFNLRIFNELINSFLGIKQIQAKNR